MLGLVGESPNILTPYSQWFCTKIYTYLCTRAHTSKSLPFSPCPKPQKVTVLRSTNVTVLYISKFHIAAHLAPNISPGPQQVYLLVNAGAARRSQEFLTNTVSYQSSCLKPSPFQTPTFRFIAGWSPD